MLWGIGDNIIIYDLWFNHYAVTLFYYVFSSLFFKSKPKSFTVD